jgi:hypothetical protein
MIETAKSLFADWYTAGIKKDASIEDMKPKREAIEKIILIDDRVFWTDVLMVYLGFISENDEGFKKIAQYFKNADEYFQLKNVHLLRLLCGCAIAEKIDANNSWTCDYLALAIIVQPSRTEGIVPDLPVRAIEFYVKECENKRTAKIRETSGQVKTTMAKPTLPSMTDHTGIPDFVKQMTVYLNGTTKDVMQLIATVNRLIAVNNDVSSAVEALSEETNVLWWLFGSQSNILKKPFSSLSAELVAILIGLELEQLTLILPGIGKVSPIIAKALAAFTNQKEEHVTLDAFIEASRDVQEILDKSLAAFPEGLRPLVPIVFSLRTFLQYSGNEWRDVLSNAGVTPLDQKYSHIAFAGQLYKELMIIRTYNSAD